MESNWLTRSERLPDMLTAEELREHLDYDPETGVFTRRTTISNCVQIGYVAGGKSTNGYIRLRVLNKKYSAHRLAWLYVYGSWPSKHLDHINGIRDDNRVANLREATPSENSRNMKKRRSARCKLKGVRVYKGRFLAQICVRGKNVHLGCYDTEEEAHAAYLAAAKKEFGAFARAE